MRKRDEFPAEVRRTLAARAGHVCSICGKPTSGPSASSSSAISDGIAAHITAASSNGPRFDSSLSPQQRRSAENGIWACTKHGREIDADTSAYSEDVLRGLKRIREDAAARAIQSGASSADQTAQLIEVPYASTAFKLFEIIRPQPYTYPTTSSLREQIKQSSDPTRILELAAEVIPGVWSAYPNVAGILSTALSNNADLWQPTEPMLSKLEELCDCAIRSGDWSKVASVEPLAFALGAKGRFDIHRRVLARLIEESHWRESDAARIRDYYGTTGTEISSIIRHWQDPWRKGLLHVNDVARLIDILLSGDRNLVIGGAQKTVFQLLEKHAAALKDLGEETLARRVKDLIAAFQHLSKR